MFTRSLIAISGLAIMACSDGANPGGEVGLPPGSMIGEGEGGTDSTDGDKKPDEPTDIKPEPPPKFSDPLPVVSVYGSPARLKKLESCEEIRESLRKDLQALVDWENGQYQKCVLDSQEGDSLFAKSWSCVGGGYSYGYYGFEGDVSLEFASDTTTTSAGGLSGSTGAPLVAGEDYSTTNTQEAGVDEADFVKTDGNYIYLIHAGKLVILSARPAESTAILSTSPIEGYARDMFLSGDRVVVFSTGYRTLARVKKADHRAKRYGYYNPYGSSYLYRPMMKATMFDVGDRSSPKVLRETYLEGDYKESRLVGSRATVVLSLANFNPWEMIGFDPTRDDPYSVGAYALELDRYLPRVRDKIHTASDPILTDLQELDCREFFMPDQQDMGQGFINVYSYPIEDVDGELGHTAIVGSPDIVYASPERLYVTQRPFPYYYWYAATSERKPDDEFTSVHAFDTATDPTGPIYLGSGGVPGHLLNQFSLGEYSGLLRAATTIGNTWGTGIWIPRNNVFVLQQQGDSLDVVGEVRDFAPGENIYSARFIGDAGYVVTFRQTDPLFVIDLKDPAAPRVAGKLEIPGYSTYLHPMDATHLLAIGRGGDESGRISGVALSMFDVGDLNEPKRTHFASLTMSSDYSSSEAEYEHKAFNYFAAKNLLVVPLEWNRWGYKTVTVDGIDRSIERNACRDACVAAYPSGEVLTKCKASCEMTYANTVSYVKEVWARLEGFAGFHAYTVGVDTGFQLSGQVDHFDYCPSQATSGGSYEFYSYCSVNPLRSIIIQDDLFTISSLGLKVNPLADLTKTTASITLPNSGE